MNLFTRTEIVGRGKGTKYRKQTLALQALGWDKGIDESNLGYPTYMEGDMVGYRKALENFSARFKEMIIFMGEAFDDMEEDENCTNEEEYTTTTRGCWASIVEDYESVIQICITDLSLSLIVTAHIIILIILMD